MHGQRLHMPVHLEFTLDYLIRRSGDASPHADQRLDGFENTIARLSRSWRPARPIAPAREIRMADETREALLAWFEGDDARAGDTLERLGAYASGAVTDDSVPEGWVRVRLDSASKAN